METRGSTPAPFNFFITSKKTIFDSIKETYVKSSVRSGSFSVAYAGNYIISLRVGNPGSLSFDRRTREEAKRKVKCINRPSNGPGLVEPVPCRNLDRKLFTQSKPKIRNITVSYREFDTSTTPTVLVEWDVSKVGPIILQKSIISGLNRKSFQFFIS